MKVSNLMQQLASLPTLGSLKFYSIWKQFSSILRSLLKSRKKVVDPQRTIDELERELSNIVGLNEFKKQLRIWAKGLIMDERRRQLGAKVGPRKPQHLAFLGNPGVGKTSMARIVGKFLKKLGILTNDRVVEVQRTDLVGEHIGHTGPKTRKKIEEAEGGILFVDEAYQLMIPESRNDFGKQALEEIMRAMESGKLSFIFAGYVGPMKHVFNCNEGFYRRISTYFVFEDYNCEELAQILHSKITQQGIYLNGSTHAGVNVTQGLGSATVDNFNGLYHGFQLSLSCNITAIAQLLENETSNQQRSKMNGGLIDQMLTKAKENLDQRLDVHCVDIAELTTITFEDLDASLALLKPNPNLLPSKKPAGPNLLAPQRTPRPSSRRVVRMLKSCCPIK